MAAEENVVLGWNRNSIPLFALGSKSVEVGWICHLQNMKKVNLHAFAQLLFYFRFRKKIKKEAFESAVEIDLEKRSATTTRLTSRIACARLVLLAGVPALLVQAEHADGAVSVLDALWRRDLHAAAGTSSPRVGVARVPDRTTAVGEVLERDALSVCRAGVQLVAGVAAVAAA